MKNITISTLGALLLGVTAAQAQTTAFTDPSGYVTVNVTPAASASSTATTAFSVSLRNSKKFASKATSISGQTVTVSGQSWTPTTEWADSSNPHLLYIENGSGVESFLITANTADTLTVNATVNLESRFSNDANIFIVEATTLGELFGATSEDVKLLESESSTEADNVYLWNGSSWVRYWYDGTNWTKDGFSNNNNDVVFPDDGVFILRRSTVALSIVFTGSVPVKDQLTSVPVGSTFVGSRYPVDTKLKDMGFLNLPGWVKSESSTEADNVYLWTGTTWERYWHNNDNWTKDGFSNNDETVISGNSALFIVKRSAGEGASAAPKPYNLNP